MLTKGRPGVSKALVVVGLVLVAVVAAVATNRRNVVAGLNVPIRMDDFVFTVTSVKRVPQGDATSGRVRYIVTLRIANQAKRVDYRFDPNAPRLIDDQGREYPVAPQAQREHEAATGDPTARPLPAGTTVLKDLVFDIPADLEGPRMKLSGGAGDVLETLFSGQKRFALP